MSSRVRERAAFVVLALSAAACSDSNGGAGGGTGGGGPAGARPVGGRGGMGVVLPGDRSDAGNANTSLLASAYGRITVAGSSAAVPSASRSFFGPARGAALGADVVQCTVHSQRDAMGPPRVELVAGVSGQRSAEAQVWFALTSADPFVRDDTFDETQTSQSMGLVVRLHESPLLVYEYEYGADVSSKPPARSLCRVTVATISTKALAGSLECRDLVATSASPDLPDGGAALPRAAASILFDCVPDVVQAGGGTGGAPSAGGATHVGGAGGSVVGGAGGTLVTGGAPSAAGRAGFAGGLGSGSCVGASTPCSLLTSSQCSLALGCTKNGSCQGSATPCFAAFGDFTCISLEGCFWDSSSQSCSGSSFSCSSFSSSGSCGLQDGCRWSDSCAGSAWSCSSIFTESTCRSQPGCLWQL